MSGAVCVLGLLYLGIFSVVAGSQVVAYFVCSRQRGNTAAVEDVQTCMQMERRLKRMKLFCSRLDIKEDMC